MNRAEWHDAIRFLKKGTARRYLNAARVLSSYFLSKWTHRPIQWGMPIALSIEPTTACNLRCPECPSGLRAFTRATGKINPAFFKTVIDELHKELWYLIFYFQGEPYLHPQLLEMVAYAHQKGIYTATSTNAHFLDAMHARQTVESGLDRLIISIDGTTQDVYQQYRRGGHLDKVLAGAREIVKWKQQLHSPTPYVFFQFLVVKPNQHQIPEIKKLAREIGVDGVRFKTAQIYDYQNGHPLIPDLEHYSRYKKMPDGTYRIKNKLSNQCWKLWHSPVVTWDGWVVPCCFDKDAQHKMGSLKENSFREIWHNETYTHFRQQLLKGRKHIDICQNCSEGTRVWG
ncbi:SPASM domain-containing protein [Thermoflavifilum thermophilum]|uniref:Radical SAM additional 4Fe4S-binding SPASM domain-containing protein n=1 Tax=Thermoflavifilum thermophilum TaxID=1393122 RepID=A0A1I7NAY9_9BACT|nr:SPASM domain-containing protein [Thermoflavifilum thermophilum]SFV31706.1 radical SAM additional 4Fe4S-binding SPASM domain-containing protein [Thermoflavifilum thermophilum]